MGAFAYAFSLTLLHSLWQSALLFVVYWFASNMLRVHHPHARRNFLFLLLFVQFGISVLTFSFYFSGNQNFLSTALTATISDSVQNIPYLQVINQVILYIYVMLVVIRTVVLIRQWNKFRNGCFAGLQKPPTELKIFTLLKSAEFGIKRKVTLWCSDAISSPVTYGFFKPVILMPIALANRLTLQEAESLVVHELTHIRNNDYLLNFVLLFSETIFFFNPFIRLLGNHLRLEREKNCDLQVVNFKYPSITYAETLLKAARMQPERGTFQLAAVSKQNQLLQRIKFFTKEPDVHMTRRNYVILSYLLIILVFCINVFTLTGFKKESKLDATALIPGFGTHLMFDKESPGNTINAAAYAVRDEKTLTDIIIRPDFKTLEDVKLFAQMPLESFEPETPVVAMNISAEETPVQEVIIKEQNPQTGNMVTVVYRMVFRDGEWHSEPVLSLTESKLLNDSNWVTKDSAFRPFNIVQ